MSPIIRKLSFISLVYLIHIPKTCSVLISPCEDVDSNTAFDVGNNYKETCQKAFKNTTECIHTVFREQCPSTCNVCCLDLDHSIKFDIGNGKMRNCGAVQNKPNLCKKQEVKSNCPKSCGLCPCRDVGGRFSFQSGKLTSCRALRADQTKCRNILFKEKCPATCGTCDGGDVRDKSDELAGDAPRDSVQCSINATVQFPDTDDASFYGYHNDLVEVEKVGEEEKCGYYNRETGWGCFHQGDAFIFNLGPQYYDYQGSETVFIQDAGDQSFEFHLLHHTNATLEAYYNDDQLKMVGILSITPTNHPTKSFSHLNVHHQIGVNKDNLANNKHLQSSDSSEFTVTVSCDKKCACTMKKKHLHEEALHGTKP